MKAAPIAPADVQRALDAFATPFHLYDERRIRHAAHELKRAFAWMPGFVNYFAVKATPNPAIMSILADEGCGMDCSSLPELLLAERIGITGRRIMFSSNNTPDSEFQAARRLGALINLDDVGLLDDLERSAGLPEFISFRYNPGPLREGNAIIGRPEEAKFGCTREQLFAGFASARERGIRRFGLHTMVASNELDPHYFIATARMLFALAAELSETLDIQFESINLGRGIGIPYRPEQQPVNLGLLGEGIRAAFEELIVRRGMSAPQIALECGRVLTGPSGMLLTRVRHLKHTYRGYAGVDATMADLMRPGIYGAYHHISVHGKEHLPHQRTYDIVGSLCENNDKFAIQRPLPELTPGDALLIHDTGAHGRAMGFNYNGKLRCAEALLRADGDLQLIRRAETLEDYFATLEIGPRTESQHR